MANQQPWATNGSANLNDMTYMTPGKQCSMPL
eukprot:CAMPEP_0184297720 /NCGR_PEP_ID=MMETSP1049-20130417/8602_1 /TAXON_ID=77928 /ORGANISM="Proteomonas sulcata, Strain CCMP704" /LENGTH=31 /DNA_ID= /DNA_START= /DNA_END= /DNA_ORIENTATION=